MAKKEKKSKPESKTPELTKAKKALDTYLKENKLDPTKDWTKDKKHGKKVTELVNKLNKERDKVAAAYPEGDNENTKKLVKLSKENGKKENSKENGKKEKSETKEKKEKKSAGKAATKYDYPLIDGREMTSAEKKKYRMEQRKLASGKAPKETKETKEKKEKKVKEKPAPEKKEKKAKDKKKKKAVKEED